MDCCCGKGQQIHNTNQLLVKASGRLPMDVTSGIHRRQSSSHSHSGDLNLRQRWGVSFAGVHVLKAVENDNVVKPENLHGNVQPLIILGEIAEYKIDAYICNGSGLDAICNSKKVSAIIIVRSRQYANQEAEFRCQWRLGDENGLIIWCTRPPMELEEGRTEK